MLELNFNSFTGAMPTLLRGGVQRRPHRRHRNRRQEDGSGGGEVAAARMEAQRLDASELHSPRSETLEHAPER